MILEILNQLRMAVYLVKKFKVPIVSF